MKIWILQTGEPLQIDSSGARAMRAINLSNSLANKGHEVTLWSANFDHISKRHRFKKSTTIKYKSNLQIKLINSVGYKKNQGMTRLFDHAQLAFNLNFALKKEQVPDIAFLGYPPIEVAWVMSRFLKRNKIPYVVDVKDMWPDVLLRALPNYARRMGKLILTPYYLLMNYTFRSATSISSISPDFLDLSIKIANRERNFYDSVNYLTNIETTYPNDEIVNAREWLDKIGVLDDKKSRCSFIGTLSNAFDWDCVIEAFKNSKTELLIAGDGPCFQDLKEKTKNQSNIVMLGRVTAVQSRVVAERTDVFIAPYKYNLEFSKSLPNKFFDAMQFGKPILSSVTGSASQFLVQKNIGLIYSDVYTLGQALEKVESYPTQFRRMGQAALDAYNKDFSGHIVYDKIVKMLELLAVTND
jgi:glycosyltransferase involved in cell wall biosynthesis